jgi:hypothetical protein
MEDALQPSLPDSTPSAPVPLPPEFTDRSTGLTIFGVGQIILGLLTALMIPFAMLGAFISRFAPGGGNVRPGQFVSAILIYGSLAAVFLVLGIGSIGAKRWAHALTLVVSWYGLAVGVLVTILLTAVMPVAMRSGLAQAQQANPNAASPELSTGIMAVIVTFVIVFVAFFLIIIPLAYVIFYSRKDVALTCRHRDPLERWTDRTPLPALGASVVLFCGAAYMFVTAISTPLFPFFGHYLTGIPGGACFLVLAAIDLYLSIAIFRLRVSAWWTAVLLYSLRLLSMTLTYARADLMQAYSKMDLSNTQLQMMNSSPIFRSHVILWWSLFSTILFFGYLIWLKRYFKPPVGPDSNVLLSASS